MLITVDEGPVERRRLVLRDSLEILALLLVTGTLFAVTLFLFRSFSAHRADLAQRWSARGRAALNAGRTDEAITALRTALVYSQEGAPDTRKDESLLAEALGQTGRPEQVEESYLYFAGLLTAERGDGPINLELARLARRQGHAQDAMRFYRAAMNGAWESDGAAQRTAASLELAHYLTEQGQPQTAGEP